MSLPANDLKELAELYLDKRLLGLSDLLERCRGQNGCDGQEDSLKSNTLSKGNLVAIFDAALKNHCRQSLNDLIGLTRAFDAFSEADGLPKLLVDHVDVAAEELMAILSNEGIAGISAASSERKRIANLKTGLQDSLRRKLNEEVAQELRKREQAEILSSSEGHLDDRLPLNRRGTFDQDLIDFSQKALHTKEPLSLIMVDIDHFKKVNDTCGHAVGDEVLVEVAQLMVARSAHKAKAYRFAGEEFALLVPDYSAEEAVGLAERIRKDIEASILSSEKLSVTASFGVACLPDQAADTKSLLEKADAALYQAKHSGRNQVCSPEE